MVMPHSNHIDLTDTLIEAMPFSDSLADWCRNNPNFKTGLKFANSRNFLALGLILTSSAPHKPNDEVIGCLVYDMKQKIFKQDFIVNVGGNNTKFILYSKRPDTNYDKYSQHINTFFADYGLNGQYYKDTHHYTVDRAKQLSIDPRFRERIESTLRIAESIETHGPNTITQAQLRATLDGIRQEKQKKRVDWL